MAFFTVAEDFQRTMYCNLSGAVNFEDIADLNYKMKFIYKVAVQKIFKSTDNYNLPVNSLGNVDSFYEEYFNLIRKSGDYCVNVDFISRLFNGEIYLDHKESNVYKFKYRNESLLYEYSCLEMLSHGKVVNDLFLKTLLNLFYVKENASFKYFFYGLFYESIQLKRRKINKKLNINLIKKMKYEMGDYKREAIFNNNFIYKWGMQILLEVL